MSEADNPDPPASAGPSKPPWYRRLSSRWKWPGWGAIGLGSVRIFHRSEDVDFALSVVRSLGGELALLAAVLASPFFALGLIVYGVLHLIFVGEPKRAFRHHAWIYVGWSIVGFCAVAIVGTALWGGVQIYIAKQVSVRTEDKFWRLSDEQRTNLGKELDKISPEQRFSINLYIVMANAQALAISDDLLQIFQQHGWNISGTQNMALRADLLDINFVVGLDWPRFDKDAPPHLYELARIFHDAGIKYGGVWMPGFDNNFLILAIGSRPPDWQ